MPASGAPNFRERMNKRWIIFLAAALLSGWSYGIAQEAPLTLELQQAISAANAERHIPVYLLLKDRLDVRALEDRWRAEGTPVEERARELVPRLQEKAREVQPELLRRLQGLKGVDLSSLTPLWITNLIFLDAAPGAIAKLQDWPEVAQLGYNAPVQLVESICGEAAAPPAPDGVEPGLIAIGAPEMWAMGYTGYGRTALISDTGTDPAHPALHRQFAYHLRDVSVSWSGDTAPVDCDGHGTHVAGTMVGLDRLNRDTIGVAFDAQWVSGIALGGDCGNGTDVAGIFGLFEWALNPDGNPATTEDIPDVINNSWRSGANFCDDSGLFEVYDALYAAGIAVVFSAGNDGPGVSTITPPKFNNWDLVRLFSVGNLDGNNPNFPIANSSSRGPSICGGEGSLLIKPEVSAPGSSVRSSYLDGAYQFLSGTSMAAPHTSGAILLLKEAFPYLPGEELMLALYFSATDLGEEGEDNNYGMGLINVPAAFDYLLGQGHTPVPPVSRARDVTLLSVETPAYNCGESVQFVAVVDNPGQDTVRALAFSYEIAGQVFAYPWEGELLPGERLEVVLPQQPVPAGVYEARIAIDSVNGLWDDRFLDNQLKTRVIVLEETVSSATVETDTACVGADAIVRTLFQGEGEVRWFDALEGGNLIGEGPVLSLPEIATAQRVYSEVSPIAHIGRQNQENGSFQYLSQQQGIRFNAFHPFRIRSVLVYAEQPGGRLVQLVRPDGSILNRVIQIPEAGAQRVELGLTIEPGEGYRLRLFGGGALGMNTGGQHGFPFVVPGVAEITGSTLGAFHYFYFYDWEIEYVERCGRQAIDVPVSSSQSAGISIVSSADTLDLNAGSATFAFSAEGQGLSSVEWNFGDGALASGAEVSHTFAGTGVYTVSAVAEQAGGCAAGAVAQATVIDTTVPTSASEAGPGLEGVKVFPNPATSAVWLDLASAAGTATHIRVFDLLGREQLSRQLYWPGTAIRLDVSFLPNGPYVVWVEQQGRSASQKIVLAR